MKQLVRNNPEYFRHLMGLCICGESLLSQRCVYWKNKSLMTSINDVPKLVRENIYVKELKDGSDGKRLRRRLNEL